MASKTQKIQKVGNSAGILLPSDWLTARGLQPGAAVRVEIMDERIVIYPPAEMTEVEVDASFAQQVDDFFRRNSETLKRLS